jgi:hypothetical protein
MHPDLARDLGAVYVDAHGFGDTAHVVPQRIAVDAELAGYGSD